MPMQSSPPRIRCSYGPGVLVGPGVGVGGNGVSLGPGVKVGGNVAVGGVRFTVGVTLGVLEAVGATVGSLTVGVGSSGSVSLSQAATTSSNTIHSNNSRFIFNMPIHLHHFPATKIVVAMYRIGYSPTERLL